jgi:glycosyltransferase involved in cell wall biosynthesis
MNILIGSYRFAPEIGGIETMSALMVREWSARGHVVRVVTMSAGDAPASAPGVEVLRRPTAAVLRAAVAWSHVYWQNNLSLELLTWAALWRRGRVVTHQTWTRRASGRLDWRDRLKRVLARVGRQVAISRAVAAELPGRPTIMPNAYDEQVFYPPEREEARLGDLIFVGRLVSDKGGHDLIDALARLAADGLRPRLTMIGAGSERGRWADRARETGVSAQVRWTGALQGAQLATELRSHRVLVVPSRWAEPFGIVALEGAACGCTVVGSRDGGLSDAIGPCGATFANGDAAELARVLANALAGRLAVDASAREAHLAYHRAGSVAERYLALFEEVWA